MNTHIVHNVIHKIVIFVVYISNVESAPPDYCFQPLNTSNCDLKPTPVFSYYKSGSRCEIEYWRGCPTLNKFDNEYDCVHVCIFHFGIRHVNDTVEQSSDKMVVVNNIIDELLQLPDENLADIDEIVQEVVEELFPKKLHATLSDDTEEPTTQPSPTESPSTLSAPTNPPSTDPVPTEMPLTEAPPTEPPLTEPPSTMPPPTEPPLTEPPPTKATTTTKVPTTTTKTESDESGLPDEVELP